MCDNDIYTPYSIVYIYTYMYIKSSSSIYNNLWNET